MYLHYNALLLNLFHYHLLFSRDYQAACSCRCRRDSECRWRRDGARASGGGKARVHRREPRIGASRQVLATWRTGRLGRGIPAQPWMNWISNCKSRCEWEKDPIIQKCEKSIIKHNYTCMFTVYCLLCISCSLFEINLFGSATLLCLMQQINHNCNRAFYAQVQTKCFAMFQAVTGAKC